MDSPTQHYMYSVIQPGHTRLVELLPGCENKVRIRLHHHAIGGPQRYEALSLVWSFSGDQYSVECEGLVINVRANLYHCLRELRSGSPRPLLWIDAISINQEDKREKSETIKLMPLIYRKAERTICWVGAPLPPTATRLLEQLNRFRKSVAPSSGLISDPDPYHSDYKVSASAVALFQADPRLRDRAAWKHLNDFLSLVYFSRVWTVQDWISSPRLVLQCESKEFSWDEFCSALDVCMFFSACEFGTTSGLLSVVVANYLRRRYHQPSGMPLHFREAIIALRPCNLFAIDPRDHVYAVCFTFRGADHPEEGERLEHGQAIDYDLESNEVYMKTAQDFGLLSMSLMEDLSQSSREKPSWVPNWSVARKTFLLDHPKSRFSASPWPSIPYQFVANRPLRCRGVQLDFVKKISHYLPPRRPCDHYNVMGGNIIIFDQWYEFAKDQSKRIRRVKDAETQLLLHYAETIQARGCNSVWEPTTPELLADKTRDFLKFLDDEAMAVTVDIQLFFASCLPSHDRRFGVTGRGSFCLVPKDTKPDDLVCIPHGNRVPLIFRKIDNQYLNLGECYIHGFMHGEAAGFDLGSQMVFNVI